MSVLW